MSFLEAFQIFNKLYLLWIFCVFYVLVDLDVVLTQRSIRMNSGCAFWQEWVPLGTNIANIGRGVHPAYWALLDKVGSQHGMHPASWTGGTWFPLYFY